MSLQVITALERVREARVGFEGSLASVATALAVFAASVMQLTVGAIEASAAGHLYVQVQSVPNTTTTTTTSPSPGADVFARLWPWAPAVEFEQFPQQQQQQPINPVQLNGLFASQNPTYVPPVPSPPSGQTLGYPVLNNPHALYELPKGWLLQNQARLHAEEQRSLRCAQLQAQLFNLVQRKNLLMSARRWTAQEAAIIESSFQEAARRLRQQQAFC